MRRILAFLAVLLLPVVASAELKSTQCWSSYSQNEVCPVNKILTFAGYDGWSTQWATITGQCPRGSAVDSVTAHAGFTFHNCTMGLQTMVKAYAMSYSWLKANICLCDDFVWAMFIIAGDSTPTTDGFAVSYVEEQHCYYTGTTGKGKDKPPHPLNFPFPIPAPCVIE